MYASQTKAKAFEAMCLCEWKQTLPKRWGHCCLCCTSEDERNGVKRLHAGPGSGKSNVCMQLMGRWQGEHVWQQISKLEFLHVNPVIPTFGKACKDISWLKHGPWAHIHPLLCWLSCNINVGLSGLRDRDKLDKELTVVHQVHLVSFYLMQLSVLLN